MHLYIHIPFCKQACHYCDFHFTTSLKFKDEMIQAIAKEIGLRKHELSLSDRAPARRPADSASAGGEPRVDKLETIYFGGGTPSLLSAVELGKIFDAIEQHFDIAADAEITLEANPDDLTKEKIRELKNSPVNRLSIGIQSFRDADLKLMNRAHNAQEAERSVKASQDAGFENITADLIYGLPDQSLHDWQKNIQQLIALGVPHISSYCLTVEPKTALAHFVRDGKVKPASEQTSSEHFHLLVDETTKAGFEHYEISNFAKPGFIARHNSSYWKREPYLGVGPSAHSFEDNTRRWNVSNNAVYLKKILAGETAYEAETLSHKERFNEYIMLGLRAKWGIDLAKIKAEFESDFLTQLKNSLEKHIERGHVVVENDVVKLTQAGKFLSDGITADLFRI